VGRHKDNVANRPAASLVLSTFLMASVANSQDFSPGGVSELPSAVRDSLPIGPLARSGTPQLKVPVTPSLLSQDRIGRRVGRTESRILSRAPNKWDLTKARACNPSETAPTHV
jgi:hypothetical protein